jgi:tripartite-type tricarboxylate transporter receptor subunit TctC
MSNRRHALALISGALVSLDAPAQPLAGQPVTIYVAYPAGGPADVIARTVGAILSERLGQPVIVENKPGAGGQIAAAAALRGKGSSYDLLLGDVSTLGVNKYLYKDFNHDPLQDFEAVAPLLQMPMVLWTHQSSPYGTLIELVSASHKKTINFASQGMGTIGHLLAEMFRTATGGSFNHIPYKGSAPAIAALLGNEVDILFDGLGPGLPYLPSGRLRALAAAGPQRITQLPGAPTTAEAGFPSVALATWFGMVIRAGTQPAAVQRLAEEIQFAMKQPQVIKRFAEFGFQTLNMTTTEFSRFLRTESNRWGPLLKELNIDRL